MPFGSDANNLWNSLDASQLVSNYIVLTVPIVVFMFPMLLRAAIGKRRDYE